MFRKNKIILTTALIIGAVAATTAQEGQVRINQDETIPALLEKKTEMVQDGIIGERYRIQLFSGDNNQASKVIKEYRSLFPEWSSTIVFETPNYKVWIGNFRSSMEADRALLQIKKSFPAAFRFRPEKR
ncbi:SPOR domain-containing protein [Salinimicrobium sp. WS361]|uniref:SPOR domain-containing protein n=1 Tax=Salinimicrobium sp. WS361 TaxID=3425123 RepID=UPI003D6F22E6